MIAGPPPQLRTAAVPAFTSALRSPALSTSSATTGPPFPLTDPLAVINGLPFENAHGVRAGSPDGTGLRIVGGPAGNRVAHSGPWMTDSLRDVPAPT